LNDSEKCIVVLLEKTAAICVATFLKIFCILNPENLASSSMVVKNELIN